LDSPLLSPASLPLVAPTIYAAKWHSVSLPTIFRSATLSLLFFFSCLLGVFQFQITLAFDFRQFAPSHCLPFLHSTTFSDPSQFGFPGISPTAIFRSLPPLPAVFPCELRRPQMLFFFFFFMGLLFFPQFGALLQFESGDLRVRAGEPSVTYRPVSFSIPPTSPLAVSLFLEYC